MAKRRGGSNLGMLASKGLRGEQLLRKADEAVADVTRWVIYYDDEVGRIVEDVAT